MSSFPCARCFRKNLNCLILKGARRCGECHRSNVACEIDPPSEQQWDRIKERENRLKTETAEATQAVLDHIAHNKELESQHYARIKENNARLIENSARLLRLQKEQSLLNDRVAEMLRRDVDSLEELEEIERLEAAAREEATRNAHVAPVPDPFDFLANEDYLDLGRLASLAAFVAGSADLGSRGRTL